MKIIEILETAKTAIETAVSEHDFEYFNRMYMNYILTQTFFYDGIRLEYSVDNYWLTYDSTDNSLTVEPPALYEDNGRGGYRKKDRTIRKTTINGLVGRAIHEYYGRQWLKDLRMYANHTISVMENN